MVKSVMIITIFSAAKLLLILLFLFNHRVFAAV